LEFPYFAGQTYDFKIYQGDKAISIEEDTIPKGGKVQLQIPPEYKGYKGMAQWYLTNSKTGGGLDLIINNENFSVSCLDSIPTAKNIVYKNTIENRFSGSNYEEQQSIFAKHDAMMYATKAYLKTDVLYPVFEKEYNSIVNEYNQFVKKLKGTNLYAARFREIVNLTMGIGSIITEDEKAKAENINDILVNQLDYGVLYTSNHWGDTINSWVQLQTMVVKNDAQFVHDIQTVLGRMPTNAIYTAYVIELTKELTKAGKDSIVAAITEEVKNSKRLLNYDGVLNVYHQDLSGIAPDLVIKTLIGKPEEHKYSTAVIKTKALTTKYTLLLFYQSGCGHCEDAIKLLEDNYKELVAKGFRIISLASDTDFAVFSNTSFALPWKDKYCDLEGFSGINFKNYAVIGTPTLFLLNQKGVVKLKPTTVEELLSWLKKN
jgi:thiol-disulfide isomerase/thioredoxin